jgi:hypothetical protein
MSSVIPGARNMKIEEKKFIAPRIELAPARCSENMAMSTAGPADPLVESGA